MFFVLKWLCKFVSAIRASKESFAISRNYVTWDITSEMCNPVVCLNYMVR